MSSPKPVFIVGNKRSGSTLLVNMLNEHPQLAITHESDIIWALYQCRQGVPAAFRPFPWDANRGLEALIASYGDALKALLSPHPTPELLRRAYFKVQQQVIGQGTAVHVSLKKAAGLAWVGDKKPVQQASPELRPFILNLFPDAMFIHVIRHPAAVVASKQEAARTWPVTPDYWKGRPAEILDQWRLHEEWVLDLKIELPGKAHTVRLEDLCARPIDEMSKLFALLDLEVTSGLQQRLATFVYSSPNEKYLHYDTPSLSAAKRIMDVYGYTDSRLPAAF